jgi:heptosyltransferase-2
LHTKVLIVKIGAIGDVVLALPLLQDMKNMSVTWIVGKAAAPILQAIGHIDSVIIVDEKKLLKGNILFKIVEVFKVWRKLCLRKFDHIITAHPDPRYRLLSLLCLKKEHRYFNPQVDQFPIRGVFHSLEYLTLAPKKVDKKSPIIWPELMLPKVDHLLEALPRKTLILLAPGGEVLDSGKKLRLWPIDYYVNLVKLLEPLGYPLGLIGLKQDELFLPYFKELKVLNFIGKTTLLELIALLKHSLGVITQDGGTLHLARLAGCKRCALFGPTSPRDFTLENEDELVFWGGDGLNCRPCYNGKYFQHCLHHTCMKQIRPEKVFETLKNKWLSPL